MLRRFQHLLIMQMASNFLSTDNCMIGHRFEGGPGFFPGFRRGFRIPCLISSGYSPVLATLFSSLATPSCISGGPYFTNPASWLSSPTLFLFLSYHYCLIYSKRPKFGAHFRTLLKYPLAEVFKLYPQLCYTPIL